MSTRRFGDGPGALVDDLRGRIEAFDEPDLPKLMVEPKADLSERGADFKPYPPDRITRHAPPGAKIGSGKYPTVTGLEHDIKNKKIGLQTYLSSLK